LVEIGNQLVEGFRALVGLAESLVWSIGHEWGWPWIVALIVVTLGVAVWGLRAGPA
jgi:hypothetical protein